MSDPEQILSTLLQHFSTDSDVKIGNMFGFPCLTVHRKVFAVSYQSDMVFKLDEQAKQQSLMLSGAKLWNPYGREKQHWVQIPVQHQKDWPKYAQLAHQYLLTLVQ